jgi:hypothetical protein
MQISTERVQVFAMSTITNDVRFISRNLLTMVCSVFYVGFHLFLQDQEAFLVRGEGGG